MAYAVNPIGMQWQSKWGVVWSDDA